MKRELHTTITHKKIHKKPQKKFTVIMELDGHAKKHFVCFEVFPSLQKWVRVRPKVLKKVFFAQFPRFLCVISLHPIYNPKMVEFFCGPRESLYTAEVFVYKTRWNIMRTILDIDLVICIFRNILKVIIK